MPSGLIMQPSDVRSAKKDEAVLPGATRKIRRWDNRHWAQPTQDARCAEHRVSVAEAERKRGSRRAFAEDSLFSCAKISEMIRLRLFRVRRIFQYHLRGDR